MNRITNIGNYSPNEELKHADRVPDFKILTKYWMNLFDYLEFETNKSIIINKLTEKQYGSKDFSFDQMILKRRMEENFFLMI
ncbi:MAG: hypothetical protein ACI318_00315 [Bacilli bacterium]